MVTMRTISSTLLSELKKLYFCKNMDGVFQDYKDGS
jgi:hypothetical protein